ncbi:hypothetical protein Sjap_019868 [Stephania japonica]|uniref:Transcription repressor n=1 Tax=Stephania japonica TaxID=461633 RepID=A0AAP0I058_9MAGN
MPNKLYKRLERLLPKIKTSTKHFSNLPPPKQIADSAKSIVFGRCDRSRTLSFSDQIRTPNSPQNKDEAATLADVDQFLLVNFQSLFRDNKTGEEQGSEIGGSCEEYSYGSPIFDEPVCQVSSNQRFFASPCRSSSLMGDFDGETGSTPATNTTSTVNSTEFIISTNYSASSSSSSSSTTTTTTATAEMKNQEIPEEGIAVLTFSTDPYGDFRGSMMEMIEARLRKQSNLEWDFMEELLFCYLNMNEKKSFKYILCAFSDLVVGLRWHGEAEKGSGDLGERPWRYFGGWMKVLGCNRALSGCNWIFEQVEACDFCGESFHPTYACPYYSSVEVNEGTPIDDYWSEPEKIIEVSLHEPNISIAQNEADEAEKEINVILERLEEPQKRSKEDQPLVLVTPPTLPCLPVKFTKGVVIKERLQIFYTADTFVSDDDDAIDSYVLEVPDELLHLTEGMYFELPKAINASFVVDISKGEGIM